MSSTIGLIEVVPYNPQWVIMFNNEADLLRTTLQNTCKALYHIGSTSIPALSAKPIIDILLEVSEDEDLIAQKLEAIGYQYKGELNIPLRRFFSKKLPFKVHLHVCFRGNPEIRLNIGFRDFLRRFETYRLRYEALKIRLANDPSANGKIGGFTKYTLGKNEFITDVISRTGFNEIYLRFCTHYAEWEAYHKICKQHFASSSSDYNIELLTYSNPTDCHIVIYQGVNIIGAMHIDNAIDKISYLRYCYIDIQIDNTEIRYNLHKIIEYWTKMHGRQLNVNPLHFTNQMPGK